MLIHKTAKSGIFLFLIFFSQNLLFCQENKTVSSKDSIYKSKLLINFKNEIGITSYYYDTKTTDWLGQHISPNFSFVIAVNNFNIGFRFKPWTINPKKELYFNGVVLPEYSELNVIKSDFFFGYSINYKMKISFEPYVGYNKSSFYVINQDVLKQVYSIPKTGGIITGITLNKLIKVKKEKYIGFYGSIAYSFTNFVNVNQNLDNGYIEWTLGIAYNRYNKDPLIR